MSLQRRLSELPRESRDTFWLLLCIAAAVLPHAGHLPLWCSGLTLLVLLWRARLAWAQAPLPGRWTLLAALLLVLSLTWITHRTLLGREAGITLLAVLMALKTLELRARRDAFVVFFLGFFLVLTQFLYSQSLLTALLAALTVWGLLSQLVLAQLPTVVQNGAAGHSAGPWRLALRQSARHLLLGAPVMVMLFVLFPRLPPFWGLPGQGGGKTGLSSDLQMGELAELSLDESIAMRIRFEGPAPPAEQLYIRGPVLQHFDGRRWRALSPWEDALRLAATSSTDLAHAQAPKPGTHAPTRPQPLRYTATVEAMNLNVLPVLEHSAALPGAQWQVRERQFVRSSDGQWISELPLNERLRYSHEAWPQAPGQPRLSPAEAQASLHLPRGLNPRSTAWAQALAQDPAVTALPAPARARFLAQALLAHIRQQPFVYTLSPGRYGELSPHLVDEFWLDRRQGFCEHFASSFVLLMRAMQVPARLVTGFQGADAQLQDGDVVVRMRQAHAWAEYWEPGLGWQRADPTAAIAPERVERGLPLLSPPHPLARINPAAWYWARGQWEQINKHWGDWVLNYSQPRQLELLRRLGWPEPDWRALAQALALGVALFGLAGALRAWWLGRGTEGPDAQWQRLQRFIIRELLRHGLNAAPHHSLRHWAVDLQRRGHSQAAQLLLTLEQERYAPRTRKASPRSNRTWRRQLKQALRQTDS